MKIMKHYIISCATKNPVRVKLRVSKDGAAALTTLRVLYSVLFLRSYYDILVTLPEQVLHHLQWLVVEGIRRRGFITSTEPHNVNRPIGIPEKK